MELRIAIRRALVLFGTACAVAATAWSAQQQFPHSAALLSAEQRAKAAERASAELATAEGRLAAGLLERDPWRAPVNTDPRLGVYDHAARGVWRATLEAQQAALLAIDTSMLGAQRNDDHARALAFCRAELARNAVASAFTRDPGFHLERLELALRVLAHIDNAERVSGQASLVLARLRGVPEALDAMRAVLTDPERTGVRAGIDACARLREVVDGELAVVCARIAATAPPQAPAGDSRPESAPADAAPAVVASAEFDAARAAASQALAEFSLWLEQELLPRAAPPAPLSADAWVAVARERTGSTLDRAGIAVALLGAIGELEPRTASTAVAPPRDAPGAAPEEGALTPQAAVSAALASRASRKVLDDLGIVPKDATQMRISVRMSHDRVVPLARAQETLDGSCWLEIGVPGPNWPAAARARRERELAAADRAALAVLRGSAGAGLRIGRRAALCSPAQRLLVDECVDVGFGLHAADALQLLPHPQNPLRLLPSARVAIARMQRLECARLLAAEYLWVERRSEDVVREDLARYGGIDAATAAVELDAIRRDPWHGIAALAWLEFRALERAIAAGGAPGEDARASVLRTFALVAGHPADRPAELMQALERARAQPRATPEPAPSERAGSAAPAATPRPPKRDS